MKKIQERGFKHSGHDEDKKDIFFRENHLSHHEEDMKWECVDENENLELFWILKAQKSFEKSFIIMSDDLHRIFDTPTKSRQG